MTDHHGDPFEREFEREFRSYMAANLPGTDARAMAETAMARRSGQRGFIQLAAGVASLVVLAVVGGLILLRQPLPPAQQSPSPGTTSEASPPVSTASPPIATPTSGPTVAPSGPYVEPVIVDRPGVPAELRNKFWHALGEVGEVGTSARMVLRPHELAIGADAGLVASYAVIHDEALGSDEPVVGPNGVTVIVREIRTGVIRRTFDSAVVPSHGILVGERLFWWGSSPESDGPDPDRGAVWGIDLADADAEPQRITQSLREQFGPGSGADLLFGSATAVAW